MGRKQSALDYAKRLGDGHISLLSQISELKEQWQSDRIEKQRELEAIRKTQNDILDMLKCLGKVQPETSANESDEYHQKHLTHLKEIWKEGAEKAKVSEEGHADKSFSIFKFLFGIASADFATGDMGSKAIHPSSRFSTCELPPAPRRCPGPNPPLIRI